MKQHKLEKYAIVESKQTWFSAFVESVNCIDSTMSVDSDLKLNSILDLIKWNAQPVLVSEVTLSHYVMKHLISFCFIVFGWCFFFFFFNVANKPTSVMNIQASRLHSSIILKWKDFFFSAMDKGKSLENLFKTFILICIRHYDTKKKRTQSTLNMNSL